MSTEEISPFYRDLQLSEVSEIKDESIVVISPPPSSVQEHMEESPIDFKTMKPGARLCHAREQKSLSIQHVANRLYLDVNILQSLENDDYENLPSTIFVRGYLRNYAKLLELPPESILEAYDTMENPQLPPLTPQITLPKTQKSTNDTWVRATTVAIVLGVIGFVMVMGAWRNFYSDLPPVPPTPMEISKVDEQIARPSPSPPISAGPNQLKETSPGGSTPPKVESSEDNPLKKSESNVSTMTSGSNGTSTLTTTPQSPTSSSASNASNGVTSTETTPVVSEKAVPEKNPNALKIIFAKETWLRITDKEGKKLYDGNAHKEVSVTGTPPFNIKLGHSDGVSVEYQGDKIIVKEHPNFNAKKKQLTLGTTSSPEG